jgi:hypothetical protein
MVHRGLASSLYEVRRTLTVRGLDLSLSQKAEIPHSAWSTQVADHLVPNQVLGFFEFFRERERGKFSVFKGLQKPFIGADSENLKMRRLPPTAASWL